MAEWYRKIGVVISVSDFESFHLTLPDGAASGAVPASLAWPGADQIYPTTWLHPDEDAIAQHLLSVTAEDDLWKQAAEDAQTYAAASFDSRMVLPALADVILGVESR
ncbi:glycosyltransferase [Arthrobacter sp. SA17]